MHETTGWKGRAALFLVSQSITLFGSTLVQMAIVWYATIATGSGAWFSEGPELLPVLLMLSLIRSVGAGIQTPAVSATLPLLAPEDRRMRFNGINAAMQSAVQFAAPAAAGAVLAAGTLQSTLWLDVGTAALGVALLRRVPMPAGA